MRATFVALALALAAAARPSPLNRISSRQDFNLKNGQDAIALNDKFKTLTPDSPCQAGDQACINNGFAQCVNGKFVVQGCATGTICAALPLVNSPGTSIACTTQADLDQRIAATGATAAGAGAGAGNNNGGNAGSGNNNTGSGNAAGNNNAGNGNAAGNAGEDPQTSLTLDPSVIADFANDGQDVPEAGQVPSLTSTNNFINFCATRKDLPLTNGKQIKTGSCNPAPIGLIPDVKFMPSSKFVNPVNLQQIQENTPFTIEMAIKNLETGFFVNAQEKYFAAPQQLNGQGVIQGHSHVVVEKVSSLTQNTPNDPNFFDFFKGLNGKADGNGILTATVDKGLPAGFYKLSSINAAANHQPVIVAVAQHASLDDTVYFEVVAGGGAAAANATAA
ncbi:hypothetical protein D9758_012208 [Tetrapyrgos nigripes]|uniref:Carbohydrate-binding module family 19 domain-containing protein n=1 Tax=Tetrapyrgos nigripes TaxID=182062 RepID=A0A8H5CC68_9AGAR|nr:hypothetical protein D9758_012208 [Tetrapyrgos nigripes]